VRPIIRAVAWAIVAVMAFTPIMWLIGGRPNVAGGARGETVIRKP
jgi:hypothetical protein